MKMKSILTAGLLALGIAAPARAATFVDLSRSGSSESVANATTGTQQAGFAVFSGVYNAGLWSGTAASFVNLNPAGATQSFAYATTGTQQAGYAYFGAVGNAGIWAGTAATFVNLNPAGATQSFAYATTGTQQAGYATIGGVSNAGIWSGTAASFVNLQSVLGGGYTSSQARGVWDDGTTTYVSGYAQTSGGQGHAILWAVPDAAPEPASAALLGLGTLLLAARRRRSA